MFDPSIDDWHRHERTFNAIGALPNNTANSYGLMPQDKEKEYEPIPNEPDHSS
ncbi:hypothetical protein TMM008_25670 [Pseudomonas sp. 008]|nr:hypothetical protein TMM008_25670 [Pseudomonas sp. 008]